MSGLAGLATPKALARGATSQDAPIVLAEIRGSINPGSANYLLSAIHRAEKAQAQAVLVELDTPGGLISSVREMTQAIDSSHIPVIVYVSPAGAAATSAGALLTLSSHLAAMAPGTNLGAAHPVDTSGKDVPGAMGQKILNDTMAYAKGLAELRGRNAELAAEIVSKSKSYTAAEALKLQLVDVIAENRAALLRAIDGRTLRLHPSETVTLHTAGAPLVPVGMSWGQRLLNLLANPNIAAILMTLGSLLIYFELSNPGVQITGILGIICFVIAFMSFQMIPIRTGGLVLLVAGVGMMLLEPFVTAHGAIAIGGVIAFALGLLWVVDPSRTDLRIHAAVWIPAILGLGGGVLLIVYAATRTHWLARHARKRMGGYGPAGLQGYEGVVESLGADGRTGKVLIRGETWDFRCEMNLRIAERVVVTEMDGMIARVRPAAHPGAHSRGES
jgi:membrane-bound serine protease (ClpP class)